MPVDQQINFVSPKEVCKEGGVGIWAIQTLFNLNRSLKAIHELTNRKYQYFFPWSTDNAFNSINSLQSGPLQVFYWCLGPAVYNGSLLRLFTRCCTNIPQTRITETREEACNFPKKETLFQLKASSLTKTRNPETIFKINPSHR